MKTLLHLKASILLVFIFAAALKSTAQTTPELIFKNPAPETGIAGEDGAVYRFADVAPNVDALVKIAGRSSSDVRITSMDLSNTGYDNAFQPQISYMYGNAPANSTWWLDFDFNFVIKGTSNPVSVSKFNLSALDIDGDGATLNEFVSFSNPQSYILENQSMLTVQNLIESLLGILTSTKKFIGPKTNFTNIDVNATQVMTTLAYQNKSFFRMRAGATVDNGGTSVADRMYSFWFKGFTYSNPVQTTLPVKMYSFNANLNNSKVDLKWVTASEINVSHFVVEKSTDGVNFSDAGLVFAYGNANDKTNYSLSDNVNTAANGVIYYRLRSIDNDGKSELSETRIIRISKQTVNNVSIVTYPNPVSNEIRITIPANWQNKKVLYEIFNANGVVAKRIESAGSNQTEAINVSGIAPGFYIVKVSFEGQVAQQKIVKQ